MPALWLHSLAGLAVMLVSGLVGRILFSLGISAVTYVGVGIMLNGLKDFALSQVSGVGGVVGQFVLLLHVPDALNLIMSAAMVKYTLGGLMPNGSIYKWHLGQPQ